MAMAPNQTAVSNGKKISQSGGFIKRERSEDGVFYMGECKGSGKKNYFTSVDFIEPEMPICRCSCPSRQFPCKHGIALLYEILADKNFDICDIPEDIQKKREKKQEKESGESSAKKETSKKVSKTARMKKIKKQLEGLEFAEQMMQNILKAGFGAMGGTNLKTYEQLSKQLGDYYLSGPQHLVNELIIEIKEFAKDGKEENYENMISLLEKFWTLIKKSKDYLTEKLESKDASLDNTELYEELGGVWKLEELQELGLKKENVDLLQLSFWVSYDEAGKQYIDKGCYADLATGELFFTYNYRPVKAIKYIKQDDSIFHVTHISTVSIYPGQGNQRIRWNGGSARKMEVEDIQKLCTFASVSIADEAKKAKNILKNALAPNFYIRMIRYAFIGKCEEDYVMVDTFGETIFLGNAKTMEETVGKLAQLPNTDLLENNVMLGGFFYDSSSQRLKLQPLSILTDTDVVRLLY